MTKGKEIKFPGKKKEKQKQCGFKDGPQRREEEEEVGWFGLGNSIDGDDEEVGDDDEDDDDYDGA
ncbi:hypothetical protein AtNW77_Chr1g0078311 [Arabidopsis thaliana]|uniref:Uncharacterized protein n=2 Tax=Arabidopsis thaliana TaxID=3702 RepID=A0A1P8AWD0_ARATH|nr:uncharacterized protein AT1G76465 [Arabidopsis thaliana]ANM60968.1 hypothetical protein AT1G76465 [Arabidopsis thaliana]VYS51215.1 unnamed protein product [Arabidopsis thaliana]|eukprot:NP_001323215.1 hypothetical protein AT1G76465 [Arabidopsis thaliana]